MKSKMSIISSSLAKFAQQGIWKFLSCLQTQNVLDILCYASPISKKEG